MRERKILITSLVSAVVVHLLVLGAMAAVGTWLVVSWASDPRFSGANVVLYAQWSPADPPLDEGAEHDPRDGVLVMFERAEVQRRHYHRTEEKITVDEARLLTLVETSPTLPRPQRVTPPGRPPRSPSQDAARPPAPRRRLTSGAAHEPEKAALPQTAGTEIDTPSSFRDNPPPSYPAEAQRRGWQGTVMLRLHIARTGRVTEVEIVRSSGHAILDAAAASAVRRWHGQPALSRGRPVATTRLLPVQFRL